VTASREPWTRRLGLRFAVTYCAIAALLFTIYAFPFELFGARQDWLTGYLAAYARMAGALLWVFDRGVVVTDTFINGRFPLQIVRNCDAIEINILFASAVLAFPAPWERRIPALLLGLLGLVAVNVLRICCLYFVGVYRPDWFSAAHEEVWPLLLVAIAVVAFWLAASHMQPETAHGGHASAG
jgi:exosortase/archaeosortase family protein